MVSYPLKKSLKRMPQGINASGREGSGVRMSSSSGGGGGTPVPSPGSGAGCRVPQRLNTF